MANPKNERKGKDELAKELDRLASGKAPQPARADDADHLSSDALLSDTQMGKPLRPKTPVSRPTTATTRAAAPRRLDRPATPIRPPTPIPIPVESTRFEFIITPESAQAADDDDAMAIPAPSADVFAPSTNATSPRTSVGPTRTSLWARRTIVPILLTNGVLLPVLGALWFLTEDDSPFRIPGVGLPIGLIAVGLVLLILGLLNAQSLRHQLAAASA